MSNFVKRVFDWLRVSHRWLHLIGGMGVGLCGLCWWGAMYGALVAGVCLEWKDKAHGCRFDVLDLICTLAGGGMVAVAWWLTGWNIL